MAIHSIILKRKQRPLLSEMDESAKDRTIIEQWDKIDHLLEEIEIDGCSHEDKMLYDKKREQRLQQLGLRVLRFTDQDVKNNLEGVLISLSKWIDDNPITTP